MLQRTVDFKSGFLIRFLACIELAQVKLLLSQCIFNCSNHVYNTIILLVPKSSTALTILAHVILLLHQCGPDLIMTLGHRAHLAHYRTLLKTPALNVTGSGKKLPLMHNDKYLEILFTELYLKNALSCLHGILHRCTVINGISVYELFNE